MYRGVDQIAPSACPEQAGVHLLVCVECEQELPSIMFSGHQKDKFDQSLKTCEVCATANASQRKDTLPCHICSHPTDVRFLLAKLRQNLSHGHTTLVCPDCRRGGFTKKNETKKKEHPIGTNVNTIASRAEKQCRRGLKSYRLGTWRIQKMSKGESLVKLAHS